MKRTLPDPKFKIYKKFYEFRRGCIDPTYYSWRSYGHFGIKMYKPWLADKTGYHRFLEYVHDVLGPAPSSKHYLIRKDKFKNFTPGNLYWATAEQNNNTRRNCCYITYRGETLSQSDWCRRQGLSINCVNIRINRLGWTPEQALEFV